MRLLPPHYRPRNVTRVLDDPQMLLGEIGRIGSSLNRRFHSYRSPRNAVDVVEEDWDTLVLLDGCRYDLFKKRAEIEGSLTRRTSVAAESWGFMEWNFLGRELHDTVYVTANPHAYKLDDGIFHRVVNLLDDDWNPHLQTVLPEVLAERTLEVVREHPNKRVIAHFMQPHFPFIGPTGRRLGQSGIVYNVDQATGDELPIWGKLRYGLVDEEDVVEAYRENLDVVLEVLEWFLPEARGKTVISSDHGNLIGDRLWPIPTTGYGHPRGMHVRPLLEVPWHVVPNETRPTIRSDPPVASDCMDASTVERRLRDLGYRE